MTLFYIVTNQHHNEKLILLGLNRLAPNEHVCIISCNISMTMTMTMTMK